jgi:predicted NUDIX family NTP pyrophosphohydrolase
MAKQSAGLVLYRQTGGKLEVLLVHPGGPFLAKKDKGVWSIPKGEFTDDEDILAAAKREFQEELGHPAPDGEYVPLGTIKQKGGKIVHAWAVSGDINCDTVCSNTFTIEWPPRSGKQQDFPEVDRAQWFSVARAIQKIVPAQQVFLTQLAEVCGEPVVQVVQTTLL